MLIGRQTECALVDQLLARARAGSSATLAIRGEAGVGKTALLEYAVERAGGMTVVRALGMESEAELQFSALLELCWPLREQFETIPAHQAQALRAALGLERSATPDRFSVGAATLSLLAAAAEAAPLLAVVDDAQWLDRSSHEALLFAMRRLRADRVALLYAAREGAEERLEAPGVESLRLTGLPREAAIGLLRRSRGPEVAPGVADRLYDATRGNPLALLELPGLLSAQQLTGAAPLENPLPVGSIVAQAFARRAQELPQDARTALLVAAASASSELAPVLAAMRSLDLPVEALQPAEDAELLRLAGGRLEFRHPLMRSAVYHAAGPSERRAAHRALAQALVGSPQADERAWQLAGAALGPDEEAAVALEHAAEQARHRSGFAAAAAALERAAQLSPDRGSAAKRLAAAADAAWRAGQIDAAAALVDTSLASIDGGPLRAEALRLRGAIEYFAGRADTAAAALLEAVDLLEGENAGSAVAAAADAANALIRARRPEQALATARRARALVPEDDGDADAEATITLGYALCFAHRYGEAEPHLRRAATRFGTTTTVPGPLQAGRLSAAMGWLGRHEQAYAYLAETVRRARRTGAVGTLPHLLASSAWQALHASRWNEACADAGEAVELAEETGQPVTAAQALGVLTWVHALRGDEARCRAYAEETQRRAAKLGFRLYGLLASLCVGLLEIGAGRVNDAIHRLEEVARYADQRGLYLPGVSPQLELAEACVRAGRAADAEEALAAFDRSDLASVPLFAAHAQRCRGLLADPDVAESFFAAALGLHADVESPFAVARTRLCYGEQLRRAGRRVDARRELRAALETFEPAGAQPWAERARGELRATGETLRRREPHQAEQLTPQELQIALHVAQGQSNKEVGAALFLSHKTVEFHLSRIYRKLDLGSRAGLIRLLATEPESARATH